MQEVDISQERRGEVSPPGSTREILARFGLGDLKAQGQGHSHFSQAAPGMAIPAKPSQKLSVGLGTPKPLLFPSPPRDPLAGAPRAWHCPKARLTPAGPCGGVTAVQSDLSPPLPCSCPFPAGILPAGQGEGLFSSLRGGRWGNASFSTWSNPPHEPRALGWRCQAGGPAGAGASLGIPGAPLASGNPNPWESPPLPGALLN